MAAMTLIAMGFHGPPFHEPFHGPFPSCGQNIGLWTAPAAALGHEQRDARLWHLGRSLVTALAPRTGSASRVDDKPTQTARPIGESSEVSVSLPSAGQGRCTWP